jgi:hypothetical protein
MKHILAALVLFSASAFSLGAFGQSPVNGSGSPVNGSGSPVNGAGSPVFGLPSSATVLISTTFNEQPSNTNLTNTCPAIHVGTKCWVNSTGVNAIYVNPTAQIGPAGGQGGQLMIDPAAANATVTLHGVTITGATSGKNYTIYAKINGSSGVAPTNGLTITWSFGGNVAIADNPGTTIGSGSTTGTTGDIIISYSGQAVTVNWFGTVINATIPNGSPTIPLTNFGFGPSGLVGTSNTVKFTITSIKVTTP